MISCVHIICTVIKRINQNLYGRENDRKESKMKRTVKKIAAVGAAIMMAASISTMGAGATDKNTTSKGQSFTTNWEYSITYKSANKQVGMMAYGYDTDWFNEDYSWTKGYESDSKAGVKRGGDSAVNWNSYASRNVWSKEEVNHNTSDVKYYIRLRPTYTNLTQTSPVVSHYKN